jgi:hypothetical protein
MILTGTRMCNHNHQQVDAGITTILFLLRTNAHLSTYACTLRLHTPDAGSSAIVHVLEL